MLTLSPAEKSALRARAHGLNPVVSIAENGLSEAVMKEIDACLKAHELIKIRVYGDDREARANYLATICEQLGAAAVQQIGKLLVVWRPLSEAEKTAKNPVRPRRALPRRPKRSYQNDR
ncbi:MAG TPA: YhbY family RNA-binding protein [Rhodocyclaceae bacterium]|nr:YhbY family RNA-binding protein [Rhodocyclaceae bacterium]